MNTFRIYLGLDTKGRLTLDQARETALGLAGDYFPYSHAIIEATGRYAPVDEPTIIVEVIATNELEQAAKVYQLAGDYKALAFQESVLVTKTATEADLV